MRASDLIKLTDIAHDIGRLKGELKATKAQNKQLMEILARQPRIRSFQKVR